KKRSKSSNLSKKDNNFVAQVVWNDQLADILSQRQHEDTYFFFNTGRSFFWADLGYRPQEPLGRLDLCKALPTCHDVNMLTRSGSSLDVIIGCATGELLWFDPMTQKRSRLNAQGILNNSAVTNVRWIPGSESHFMASFQDGAVVIFDKHKEDHGNFNPQFAMDPMHPLHIAKPSKTKYNPVTYWQASKKAVTAFAFSPDCQHVAIVSMDGRLRIVDFLTETLEDTYSAYFGGLHCVCWSPDGKYILTGGQDDLITIWDFYDQRILARCQGHQSWVNNVAFDPWRCDETNYRFGSVGEDTKILFWDFSVSALHRPKSVSYHRYPSSNRPNCCRTALSGSASSTFHPNSVRSIPAKHENVFHEVTLRNEVAILEPIMAQSIHRYPVCSVTFRDDSVITTCRSGHIKIWSRP
ncbi:WD40-repeat-containing domain protein, partial [Dimargaris cristalligena]